MKNDITPEPIPDNGDDMSGEYNFDHREARPNRFACPRQRRTTSRLCLESTIHARAGQIKSRNGCSSLPRYSCLVLQSPLFAKESFQPVDEPLGVSYGLSGAGLIQTNVFGVVSFFALATRKVIDATILRFNDSGFDKQFRESRFDSGVLGTRDGSGE